MRRILPIFLAAGALIGLTGCATTPGPEPEISGLADLPRAAPVTPVTRQDSMPPAPGNLVAPPRVEHGPTNSYSPGPVGERPAPVGEITPAEDTANWVFADAVTDTVSPYWFAGTSAGPFAGPDVSTPPPAAPLAGTSLYGMGYLPASDERMTLLWDDADFQAVWTRYNQLARANQAAGDQASRELRQEYTDVGVTLNGLLRQRGLEYQDLLDYLTRT